MLSGKRLLLIVSGGIAAYKTPDLVRRLRGQGAEVRVVMTPAAAEFVTPLSLASVSGHRVYQDLFSLTDEAEMGHIELSRAADLVVVAPASADLLAKLAHGLANDLASTLLLATDKEVLAAPAMNLRMWQHPATQDNLARLKARGLQVVGPDEGEMACGEYGPGRMAEPDAIVAAVEDYFNAPRPLAGLKALVTSGPTHEPIDPVRYIANRSSGRQGHAIAAALAHRGAAVTLVTGPVQLPDPQGVQTLHVESADEMLQACRNALPVDVAVCAAAVSDWRASEQAEQKIKKDGTSPPALQLSENPDILAQLSKAGTERPGLVIGFAAETRDVAAQATAKRERKGCDWILANDVSAESGTFGGPDNSIILIDAAGREDWPRISKEEVAERLAARIAQTLDRTPVEEHRMPDRLQDGQQQ
ncbi:bifunctional phosphopantothenoylcysteine decarboxylase/phosphopantothenate--cysteine ligase CoaBC [Fodinicurvata fenggangensis]|uniref:bifunctional phosphopantothenoylcysteine decarboxylase/phosphopantothenate--cysteine ligase CoaBC n=1 Tax=Fodinicurvata fenggangensis TaxID=1121830 RepID=UPI00047C9E83|nr:bifunctional phosphopantothenoylcysteine decarboxylase/phosphopantothenate--cysteine ligase CoaBC [Fodinicurvata fenggangensis]